MGQTRMLTLLHLATSSSYTALAKTTYNKKYVACLVLVLELAEWVEGNKESCKEIASNEASKKTSLT
jgi:hypothetical protein